MSNAQDLNDLFLDIVERELELLHIKSHAERLRAYDLAEQCKASVIQRYDPAEGSISEALHRSIHTALVRNNKFLSRKLKELVQEQGITQAELAEKLGTTQTTVSRYLSGEREPGSGDIKLFCELLSVSPNELFGIANTKPRSGRRKTSLEDVLAFLDTEGPFLSEEEKTEIFRRIIRKV